MNTTLLLRAIWATLSVVVPMWLITHVPSESAFAVSLDRAAFDIWQGLMVLSSFMIALLMARLLVRS